jgi:hypothetical protein
MHQVSVEACADSTGALPRSSARKRALQPVPKLYSLQGLRRATWMFGAALLVGLSLLVAGLSLASDPALHERDAFIWAGLALATAAVAGGCVVALLLTALREAAFQIGLTHLPGLLGSVAAPAAALTGPCVGASAVLVVGRASGHIESGHGASGSAWVVAPLLLAGFVCLGTFAAATAYAHYMMRLRQGHVARWRARLAEFQQRFSGDGLARVSAFVEAEESSRPLHVAARGPCFPGLSARGFHDDLELDWMRELRRNFAVVRSEIMAVVSERSQFRQHYPGNRLWKSFKLVDNGKRVEANCARCPITSRILSSVASAGEVMISLLEPGASLSTHFDFAAPMLTYHLAIDIPDDCGLRVGSEVRHWVEGTGLVLDTTYEHEAWNDSDRERVVLIVDFPHPELTAVERAFWESA